MLSNLFRRFADWLISLGERRSPDVVIGTPDDPYLLRWHLIPRNPLFNIYLHQFARSDDDRALHDHPWLSASVGLRGTCFEHTIKAGGIHRRAQRTAGDLVLRSARLAHRIELPVRRHVQIDASGRRSWTSRPIPYWTLFITGPRVRRWGFHCQSRGWVHWKDFTDPATHGATVGRGCDQ